MQASAEQSGRASAHAVLDEGVSHRGPALVVRDEQARLAQSLDRFRTRAEVVFRIDRKPPEEVRLHRGEVTEPDVQHPLQDKGVGSGIPGTCQCD